MSIPRDAASALMSLWVATGTFRTTICFASLLVLLVLLATVLIMTLWRQRVNKKMRFSAGVSRIAMNTKKIQIRIEDSLWRKMDDKRHNLHSDWQTIGSRIWADWLGEKSIAPPSSGTLALSKENREWHRKLDLILEGASGREVSAIQSMLDMASSTVKGRDSSQTAHWELIRIDGSRRYARKSASIQSRLFSFELGQFGFQRFHFHLQPRQPAKKLDLPLLRRCQFSFRAYRSFERGLEHVLPGIVCGDVSFDRCFEHAAVRRRKLLPIPKPYLEHSPQDSDSCCDDSSIDKINPPHFHGCS